MNNTSKTTEKIKKICAIALLCALAFAVSFCFPIKVQFLTFDAKDAIIAIGGMFFGPLAALSMSIIVPFLEFLTLSDTGIYGLIMNFLSSAAFSITASLVYKYKRKMSGAVIGLCASVFITTAVMLLANYFITPIYAKFVGFPLDIVEVLPKLILPFNLTKSVLNSALVLLLYKPFTTALKATTLVPKGSTSNTTSSKVTVITAATAIILLAAALLIYLTVLGGSIQLFKF
ncbi:MAG: ECF transporter S component [Ruminococcaceae bacterium]|nr:ECF transporter S component [Oscillospiraceae bacterium]